MSPDQLVAIGWLAHIVVCHFVLRHIRNNAIRASLTILPCVALTYVGSRDLPQFNMNATLIISLYWIMSMRLVQMIVVYPHEQRPFHSFLGNLFWSLFPLIPSDSREKQWPIMFDVVSAMTKLIINQWLYRWIITCEPSESRTRSIMVAFMILTMSHISDLQIAFVRLVTRDKYTILSMSYYPLFSKSLREFWGRRYNRVASAVFKECIFKPINEHFSAPAIASLATFIISGLLHAHGVAVTYNSLPVALPTLAFFVVHGILCCVESYLSIRLPAPVGWLMTHSVLFVTLPLMMGAHTRQGAAYFGNNPPPFLDAPWLPKLPVPSYCP